MGGVPVDDMAQVLVRYFLHQYAPELPHDDTFLSDPADEITQDHKQQLDSFVIETDGQEPLTLAEIEENFPLEGSFQFRFKYQIESNYIWLDVNDPNATVPRYGRNIYMKVRVNHVLGQMTEGKEMAIDLDAWEEEYGWTAPNSVCAVTPTAPPVSRRAEFADSEDTYTENSESCDAFVDAEVIIEELRDKIQDRFDAENDEHVELLQSVFEAVFPGQKLKGVESVHWTTIGLEDANPTPLLRGTHCSIIGLNCLLHLLRNYYSEAHRMIVDNTGEAGYSFVQYGLGLSYTMVQCMGFDLVNGVHPTAQLLLREPDAFEELFCALYLYGDQRWVEGRERDMDTLLFKLRERIEEGLNSEEGASVIGFRDYVTRSKDVSARAKESLSKAKEGIGSMIGGFKSLFK